MRRPAVVAEVQERVTHRLRTEGYEIGVGTLIEIAGDKAAPKAPRVMAAKALVELSGGLDQVGQPKELHEMSRAELQAAAEDARRYLEEYGSTKARGSLRRRSTSRSSERSFSQRRSRSASYRHGIGASA